MTGRRLLACALALALAACGGESAPPQARPITDPGSVSLGDVEMHYSAVPTMELDPAIAQRHGVVRAADRVLLHVGLLRRDAERGPTPIAAAVNVTMKSLLGDTRPVPMTEVREPRALYYLAEIRVKHREILLFSIDAAPLDGGPALQARLQREFFTE